MISSLQNFHIFSVYCVWVCARERVHFLILVNYVLQAVRDWFKGQTMQSSHLFKIVVVLLLNIVSFIFKRLCQELEMRKRGCGVSVCLSVCPWRGKNRKCVCCSFLSFFFFTSACWKQPKTWPIIVSVLSLNFCLLPPFFFFFFFFCSSWWVTMAPTCEESWFVR